MKLVAVRDLDDLCRRAASAPRGRAHLALHAGNDDPVQRFFVAFEQRSYLRPHRHRSNAELATIVRGRFDLLVFDDAGVVLSRDAAGIDAPNIACETAADTWHTLVAGIDGSVILEVKQGPYDPAVAAQFAPWAPPEGDTAAPMFQAWLRRAQPGDRAPS